MVTVNAVDSFAYAYPERVTRKRTTDETVREPIDFTSKPVNTDKKAQDAATEQEVKMLNKHKKNMKKTRKIFYKNLQIK